jgi:uncharacterized protein
VWAAAGGPGSEPPVAPPLAGAGGPDDGPGGVGFEGNDGFGGPTGGRGIVSGGGAGIGAGGLTTGGGGGASFFIFFFIHPNGLGQSRGPACAESCPRKSAATKVASTRVELRIVFLRENLGRVFGRDGIASIRNAFRSSDEGGACCSPRRQKSRLRILYLSLIAAQRPVKCGVMGVQDVIRWLLPREDHFFDFLERQAVVARDGAAALSRFRDDAVSAEMVREKVGELEHRGDEAVHELEDALARTFVTPIDREDLHKISNELDNIIDWMNLAARSCSLYGLERPTPPMVALMDTLVECTVILASAMPMLRQRSYGHLVDEARKIRRLEKEGDQVFRRELSRLFHDTSIDARQLLKEKEILEDLEAAVDECDHVAETLSNLAVKHG